MTASTFPGPTALLKMHHLQGILLSLTSDE